MPTIFENVVLGSIDLLAIIFENVVLGSIDFLAIVYPWVIKKKTTRSDGGVYYFTAGRAIGQL